MFDQLGTKPERLGNRSNNNAPRNVYRCRDGRWVAVSAPVSSVAERMIRLVGRPELVTEPWFTTGAGRAEHRDVIDDAVARWIGMHDRAEVISTFEQAEAAVAPIYEVDDIMVDPHFQTRSLLVSIPDAELGTVRVPNVPFRLSATPGRIRWAGPRLDEHSDEVFGAVADSQPEEGND